MSNTTGRRDNLGAWERLAVNARAGGVRVSVHVRPKSSRSAILGVREGDLDVALTSAPVDGAANAELQKLIARALEVTQRDVAIVAGSSSRSKVLEVNGISVEEARAAGFDFVFTHGLCTMAICTHRALGLLGVDDPGRVSRVAVRFASPTPMGADLSVAAYRIDERSLAFEAAANGATTITHGRLELRT